jgi:hypothetical protein
LLTVLLVNAIIRGRSTSAGASVPPAASAKMDAAAAWTSTNPASAAPTSAAPRPNRAAANDTAAVTNDRSTANSSACPTLNARPASRWARAALRGAQAEQREGACRNGTSHERGNDRRKDARIDASGDHPELNQHRDVRAQGARYAGRQQGGLLPRAPPIAAKVAVLETKPEARPDRASPRCGPATRDAT